MRKQWQTIFFLASKITADGDFSHVIKRCLFLARKAMTNRVQRHYFANKGPLVKAMVFPVVKYSCESWTIKTTEHQRINAFELWYWRRLLRVPWTARKSNQSILKEISPEYSLEVLTLNLELQYCGHLMQRTDWFEKTLRLGKIEGRRRRGWQRMRWLDGITDSMVMSSRNWWWTGRPGVLQSMGLQSHAWLSNWTELMIGRGGAIVVQRVEAKVLQNITQHTAWYIIQNKPPQQLSKFSGPTCQLCWDWETLYSRVLSTKPD